MTQSQSLAVPRVIPNDWKRLDLIVNKIKFHLGSKASPTFAGLTLTGLTASRLIWGDANKALASKDLVDLVAGTANEIDITDDTNGGVIIGIVNPLIVAKGGTGVATLTDHGILLGSGIGAITPLGVASNGQIPIGSAGADPVLATISGTADHISIANGAGSIIVDLDTNTQTLLGSFNGIFLEKLNFTISEAGGTVTGSLEQDGGGDLTQKFSDGYTTLDCTPAKTINLTAYVGTDAVPKLVFVYILQSNKTTLVASNSDWPATEHNKIARLLLKSAVTTGTDGGALVNQNWNDYAFDATGEGHILDIEHRLRQEPAQYEDGLALTLKNSAGAALTTGNSSTAVELVITEGRVFQLHLHTFPAFDMYSVGTDFAQIANQVVDEGGAYVTTADLVTDITHYVDGSDAGVAIGVNKYFNLVIWGVMNREGEASHIMINLPTGQYTTSANAVADIDGTSTFDIPFAFKGTGFLIARLTFRLIAGAEWTYIAIEDLRGQVPVVSAGVGITTTDHALLANLAFASAGHTGFQAQGDVLDDLNTLGAAASDGQFIVATGAGVFAYESGATVRTSLGLGITDNPQFATVSVDNYGLHVLDTNGSHDLTFGCGSDLTADRAITFSPGNASRIITLTGNPSLANWFDQDVRVAANPIFAGITIADGGTIGQAAGPLLTFDDTNNLLGITGSSVRSHRSVDDQFMFGFRFEKDRAGATVENGDNLGYFRWSGYDGTGYIEAAELEIKVDGVPNTNDMPTKMLLKTTPAGGTSAVTRLTIGADGISSFTKPIKLLEQAAADGDTAAYGQIWVKNDAPNTLWFTDDDGTDVQLGAGHQYVQRAEQTAFDWTLVSDPAIVTDGNWYDLDCSAIVPANAVLILFRVFAQDDVTSRIFSMRKNGYTNVYSTYSVRTQAANIAIEAPALVACDANRVVEYYASNTAWTNISLLVIGWWVPV